MVSIKGNVLKKLLSRGLTANDDSFFRLIQSFVINFSKTLIQKEGALSVSWLQKNN